MKVLLIAGVAAFALAANAGDGLKSPKDTATKAPSKAKAVCCCAKAKNKVQTAEVTGSKIPVQVDQNGRPINSTLKVNVVDEESIRTFGLGSPSGALARMPMVSLRGRR